MRSGPEPPRRDDRLMPKILIAEDESDIRELIAFTLTFGGFDVIATSNGEEAVAKAAAERPDVILLDVRMPRMTGYEACTRLKADPATRGTPVLFLSAKGQEDEVKSGLAVGALDYILKPFSPESLIERVKAVIAEHARPAPPAPEPDPPPAPPARNGARPPTAPLKPGIMLPGLSQARGLRPGPHKPGGQG